jgi:hypothetical protein
MFWALGSQFPTFFFFFLYYPILLRAETSIHPDLQEIAKLFQPFFNFKLFRFAKNAKKIHSMRAGIFRIEN